ncbi:hypothetical protein [Bacillus haynesii]|uniref:hypothetical protein n=1 Tax=Bacillus haynesii TaxID=1925021 RepID=UPI002281ACF9|nr:hypothetical protein [Bacillus haynesii]MCY9452196.1 hypothetical protein [Bacillus haynesii]
MAKLHGVKTLDMVNGEITKVAYGGAEYERVEGAPRIFGRAGDLLLNGYDHSDLEVNAFYKIVNKSGYGKTIYDEVEDSHGSALIAGSVFRKVSASHPSLEDRVSTNEKDIESLKSDVAALKGETETEYVRIDKSEAKAGDFVKFDEAPNEYLTAGEYYGIYRVDDCGDPRIHDDEGDDFDTHGEVFEVYRKVSGAEPKPERLKVGNYAKVVARVGGHLACEGDVVLIKADDKDSQPFLCGDLNGEYVGYFFERELVRATDEEVAEAKDAEARAKFKKGAKVRLKSGGGEKPLYGFENGKVYTVVDNDYPHSRTEKKIQLECAWYYGFATPDQLELLSEEDAAEIEKWAAIGREVGEYKVGDVVSYDDAYGFENSGFGEVVSERDGNALRIEAVGYYGDVERYDVDLDKLELVTPVEARFDRKDDE